MTSSPLTIYSPKHRVVKRNVVCPYCDRAFGPGLPSEEEHVIGRRFVPKGTLAGQWNLVLRACGKCNDDKADLESDISAITMQPDAEQQFAAKDLRLAAEAQRKGQTINRRTGRFVSEVEAAPSITMCSPGLSFSFSFVQPAQLDQDRLHRLAWMQLIGFFFMLTYDEQAQRGHYWVGEFAPIVTVRREDWGNPHLRWIEQVSADWALRLQAITADGFFKALIRRRLGEPPVWSWALEWNQNYRLAGFMGEESTLRGLLADLPDLGMRVLEDSPERRLRFRQEIPLAEADDTLFRW